MLGRISPWRHVVVAVTVLGCALLTMLGVIGGGKRVQRFDAKQITVQPSGVDGIRIREVVDEDFGTDQRHGYERNIPTDFGVPTEVTATSPDANADVGITDLGAETRIRLGDASTTITGQHRYILSYTLANARVSSGELALDIISAGEKFETGHFEVVVVGMELTNPLCNVGSSGTSGGCTLRRNGDAYRVVFEPLKAGDGVTIGGTIMSRTAAVEPVLPALPSRTSDYRVVLSLAMLLLGSVGGAAVFVVDRRKGRNEVFSGGAAEAAYGTLPAPSSDGVPSAVATSLVSDDRMAAMATIEFVPPKGVEPWQGSVLLRERINDETVAAWLSGLVAKEAVTLEKVDGDLVMASGPKRNQLDATSTRHIDAMMQNQTTLTLGTYDKEFAAAWKTVKTEQDELIKASGWWRRLPPNSTSGGGVPAVILVIVFAVVFFGGASAVAAAVGIFKLWPLALVFGLAVPMVVALGVYHTMLPSLSATGSALALRTESFRRFLVASEGQHVEWAWKQGLLREYSAWAVALGAADAWGKALANSNVAPNDINMTSPLLVYSMGSAFAHTRTAPSSSGSSGFSGGFSGGSVGGGGGGGSSGSW